MEIIQALQNLSERFLDIPWRRIFFALRYIFIVLDVILVALFIYVFFKALKFRPPLVFNPAARAKKKKPLKDEKLIKRWQEILRKAESAPPQSLTLGVIEADGLVDDVLKKMNLPGEHMADRLERLAARDLKSINKLWQAHRIRNDLVHTPGFVLNVADAKRVLTDYESFLKEIGILGEAK